MRVALLLLLGTAALAADPEVLREEALNFRVRGTLPDGWTRRDQTLHFVFRIDGIAHAHVQIVGERLAPGATVDLDAQLSKRSEHYRFPGAPADAAERREDGTWGGEPARSYEHEVILGGVLCRRRVTAAVAKSTWYERIETIYGEATEADPRCADGLRLFRDGFRFLAPPVPPESLGATAAETFESAEFGYRLRKPEDLARLEVDTGIDPGCRLAFGRKGPGPNQHLRVRLFEYGVRAAFEPRGWIDVFHGSFAAQHKEPRLETIDPPPAVVGAKAVHAIRLIGKRDGFGVVLVLLLLEAPDGRILALETRSQEGAEAPSASILEVLAR